MALFSKISTKRAYRDLILLDSDLIKFGFNCALIEDDVMFNCAKSKSEKVPLKKSLIRYMEPSFVACVPCRHPL